MNITVVFVFEIEPVSLRSAWLMRRACRPMCASPISPSISARGTSAATESITTRLTAPERTSVSVISSACSPLSGCEMSSSSMLTPHRRDGVQCECRLARGLRAIDLDHPATRVSTNAEREVEREGSARDGIDLLLGVRAELHDRALAELLFDLKDRLIDRPRLFCHCHLSVLTP